MTERSRFRSPDVHAAHDYDLDVTARPSLPTLRSRDPGDSMNSPRAISRRRAGAVWNGRYARPDALPRRIYIHLSLHRPAGTQFAFSASSPSRQARQGRTAGDLAAVFWYKQTISTPTPLTMPGRRVDAIPTHLVLVRRLRNPDEFSAAGRPRQLIYAGRSYLEGRPSRHGFKPLLSRNSPSFHRAASGPAAIQQPISQRGFSIIEHLVRSVKRRRFRRGADRRTLLEPQPTSRCAASQQLPPMLPSLSLGLRDPGVRRRRI